MLNSIVACCASVAVVVFLFAALYGWFSVTLLRFNGLVAKDALDRWDARLARLEPHQREELRAQPPVEVLEAIVALPSPRLRRFQLSFAK